MSISEISGFKEFVSESSKGSKKKSSSPESVTTQMLFPTGFIFTDYGAGNKVVVFDDDDDKLFAYDNVGISMGSLNTVISKSQGGKTSFCIKMAAAILEPWVNSVLKKYYLDPELNPKIDPDEVVPLLQIIDSEHTLGLDYVKKLTKWKTSQIKKFCDMRQINTDTELIQTVIEHCNYKESKMGKIKMKMKDLFGDPIECYPPTIILIDSLTEIGIDVMSEMTMDSFQSSVNNTAGMQRAKRITSITHFLNMCSSKYNITIFSINHINVNPQISITPVAKQYRGLKQGETLNGGERAIYLASNIIRIDVVKAVGDDKPSKVNLGEGVRGNVALVSFIKCKSNSKENTSFIVFTNETTHDPILSTLYNAKELGVLPKSGNFFYLEQYPDIKFTLKTARDVFYENPYLIDALYESARKWCNPLLDTYENAKRKSEKQDKDDFDEYGDFAANTVNNINF